jgi:tripartite-type tricarboxylate transporter receptor subunit TctC
MRSQIRRTHIAVWAAASLLAAALPAAAQSPEEFYKGNTLRVLIGHPPGGSYDLYARLAADFMKKHVPGNPTMIVEHKPGGGGLVATAFFYAQAPRDGSMIGLFPETIAHTQLLEPKAGKWKVEEMSYIGSFASVNAAFVIRKNTPAKTIEEMKKTQINVGCTGVNAQSCQHPAMLRSLAGLKFNMITGYPGSAEFVLALEKGEVDLVSSAWNNWRATHRDRFTKGDFIAVIQGGLRRNKELPNVPLMQELVSDPNAKKVIEFANAGAAIGRALIAPPGIPADRLAVLRAAFDKMVRDPEFLAAAEKRQAEIDPTPGVEVQKDAIGIIKTPKELIDMASAAMKG